VARGEPGAGLGAADRWDIFAKARLADLIAPGEDRTGFLLRFTISHPGVHTVIVGTKNPDHLAGNVKAIQAGRLPPDVYEEAKRRLTEAGEKPEQVVRSLAERKQPATSTPKAAAKPKAVAEKRKAVAKKAVKKPAAKKKTVTKKAARKKAPAKKRAPAKKKAPAKKRK
jgi:predicted aldo/keto reductase-like oxidoreductase